MLLTIVSFLFVFTIIAVVHEFGHLYFSKRAGIRVHEFGLGFGPTLWQTTKNGTLYKINLLPILGYVKIAGIDTEDPAEKDTPEDEKYQNKPVLQKFLSIVAGAAMNIVLGFIIFSLVFMINGIPSGISNELATIAPGSEAENIGLQVGDKLLAIDGVKYKSSEDAVKKIHESAETKLTLTIERDKKEIKIKATPKLHKRMKVGLIGFSLKALYEKVNPFKAIYYGAKETLGLMLTILALLGRLLVGKIAMGDLAGPVGIAQITGQYAQGGALSLLSFIGFFSVNVAVINLLPIPALDGGRLVFVIIEAIRRKPVPIETENKIHGIAMYALLALLAVLTVNDLLRISLK
ncbi:MAG: RIP metalloprotease RseP [bacterium]|nr:RIP metalloprotease RseP [Candidatus Margulisiibacteriota bacterium]